jgi:hypothetical protein
MSDKRLALRRDLQLAPREHALARRGLHLIADMQQTEVRLTEADLFSFFTRHRQVMQEIGGIPDAFLEGKTSNPHDVAAFDVNRKLVAFDRISMNPGYVLDWVYDRDHHSGEPLVYAREISAKPLATPDQYYASFNLPRKFWTEPTSETCRPFLDHLTFEQTPLGCFQFAMFCMTIRRFYLFWHSNYNDRGYLCTDARRSEAIGKRLGSIKPRDVELLTSIDVRPRVMIQGSSSQISLFNFVDGRGYSFVHIFIRHPNSFERFEEDVVIQTECTILY